jgi:flagellar biosynthesis anti-sigma factor FlgM
MRIPDTYTKLAADQAEAAAQRKAVEARDTSNADQANATVQQGAVKITLSAKAQELADAHAAAGGVDEAKVGRLRSAIEAGTFKIDTQKIANRISDGD